MKFRTFILALATLVCSTQVAPAAVVYNLGFEQENYTVLVGTNLQVNVYLYETLTSPGDSSLLLVDPLAAGIVSTQIAGTGTSVFGSVAEAFGPDFDAGPLTTLDTLDFLGLGTDEVVNAPDNTIRRVRLGHFNVAVGSGVNQLSFSAATDFFTLSATDITPTIGGAIPPAANGFVFGTATITAVPEPTGGSIAVVGLAAWWLRRRRR